MDLKLDTYIPEPSVSLSAGGSGARQSNLGGWYVRWGKRSVDISLILLALPIVVPVLVVCALIVAIDGGRPLFWQTRMGFGGKEFRMLKLRSMCPDAESKLAEILHDCPKCSVEWEIAQKLSNDPRVTGFGAFLRKSSLDELPQLWNVLRGDMSLVGPRPMMPSQSKLYQESAYFRLRPGVTGPWQVFARNHGQFSVRETYDRLYEGRVGLLYDIRLILQTLRVVVRGTGQ